MISNVIGRGRSASVQHRDSGQAAESHVGRVGSQATATSSRAARRIGNETPASMTPIESFTCDLIRALSSDLSPEDKLHRIVRGHVRFVIANRSFLTGFFSEEANLPRA